MASKLISQAPYEAPNPLELSLREAYTLFLPQLTPPWITFPNPQDYSNLNKAIIYGVLCHTNLAPFYIKYLHVIVNDGYCFFTTLISQIVDGLYSKLFDSPKKQLLLVVSDMMEVLGTGFDSVLVSLLRQIVGGDFSDGNVWLSNEMVNLLVSKWDMLLAEVPEVLTYALYTYLRLLSDHHHLPCSPRLIDFCVRMLREQFDLCMRIGRDLIRLLQDLFHVPEFRSIWKDLVLNPGSFGVPVFTDISVVYGMRTPNTFILLRITPEMETYLRFLLTHVKLGTQKRHQGWFAKKFLFASERETLISDIVRFICCAHHPSHEVLQSNVIPRWAVIGWLLKSCTKKYIESNVKLSLFYDFLFFNEKVDSAMNIEPVMLLITNSIPRYMDITNGLLDFLLLLIENYDKDRKHVIREGVSSAMSVLVRKGLSESFDVLTSCNLLSPPVKQMLQKLILMMKPKTLKEPQPHADSLAFLIGKVGENMKKSSTMGRETVEKILFLHINPVNSADYKSDLLASEVEKELELVGYKLFSPLDSSPNSADADDEVDSVTAAAIRIFIFTQHQRLKEVLLYWSRNGCLLRARLLSYALRLAYEANIIDGHDNANHTSEIKFNKMTPLLNRHVEGYLTFRNIHNANAGITSNFKVDKTLISMVIDGAFGSYMIMNAYIRNISSKDLDVSPGKVIATDVMSCSLWRNKEFKFPFFGIFRHLSDLCIGDPDVIHLLVSRLDRADLVSLQIDVSLKRFSIFGGGVHLFIRIIKRSVQWDQVEQHKLWGLIISELSVSNFPVEELILDCFFSNDLDQKDLGIVGGGLMTICSCCGPKPELMDAIMLLPDNKFPDFSAAVLSHWSVINASMLLKSIVIFLDKVEKKNDNIEIIVNKSALGFLLDYLDPRVIHNYKVLEKLALNISDREKRIRNSSVAVDTE